MLGYIANTDYDWYRFLKGQGQLGEVNFWQPSGSREFRAIPTGAPFYFKLKRPYYAIAGFGYFARNSILPAWLAWGSFKEANGAPDFMTMKRRIEKYRSPEGISLEGQYEIGCLMISNPVFFDKHEWIPQPRSWSPNIVQGKTYDLTMGEGRRVYERCRLLGRTRDPLENEIASEKKEQYGKDQLIRPRLGQGIFRISVLDAYGRACAVSEEHSLPVLEAAHIKPYSESGTHDVSNGLLLRADIHRLFDMGYVTVSPDHHFEVARRLKEDFDNGKTYYPLHGRKIRLPLDPQDQPDQSLLEWHSSTRFLA